MSSRMSVRCIRKPSQAVIAGAIGDWQVLQPQRVGDQDRRRRPGVTVPRQDVEDDVGGMDAVGARGSASRSVEFEQRVRDNPQ
jgi:hypothetical protein